MENDVRENRVHFPKVEHYLARRHKAHEAKKNVVCLELCPLFFIDKNNGIGHGQASLILPLCFCTFVREDFMRFILN